MPAFTCRNNSLHMPCLGRPLKASSVNWSRAAHPGELRISLGLQLCWGPVHVLGSAPPAAQVLASRRQLRGREGGSRNRPGPPVHVLGSAPPAAHMLASRRQLRGRERPSMAGSILSWAGPSGRAPCILCSQHAGVGTGCSPTAAALLLQLCSCSVEEQVIHVSNQLHWQWTPVIQS